jgi:hypothetical protein
MGCKFSAKEEEERSRDSTASVLAHGRCRGIGLACARTRREKLFRMRRLVALGASVVASALLLSACSAAQFSRICQHAGGRYTNEGCDASTPARKAARDWCETHGGVYLGGQEQCVLGGGGP